MNHLFRTLKYCLLLWLLVCNGVWAQAFIDPLPSMTTVDANTRTVSLNDLELVVQPNSVAVEDLVKMELDWNRQISSPPEADEQVWHRFSIQYQGDVPIDRWIVLEWPLIRHVQMHVYDHITGEWTHSRILGTRYPRADRYIDHRYFLMPLNMEAGHPLTVYLNVRASGVMKAPVSFWGRRDFISSDQFNLIVLGIFCGALLIMLLYNGAMYAVVRQHVYRAYTFYLSAVILYTVAANGLGSFYFWPENDWLNERGFRFIVSFVFFSAIIFVRQFLNIKEIGGWQLVANNISLAAWSMMLVITVLFNYPWIRVLIFYLSLASCLLAFVIGATLWNRDVPMVKVFTVSWAILIGTSFIYTISLAGIIPLNIYTRYSQMIGFVIELNMLGLALASQINREKDEREQAQSEALLLTMRVSEERKERLRAQADKLAMQQNLNDELEQRVEQRTEELEEAMRRLEDANIELTKLSVTDQLSQVHNRRYFDDTLIDEYKRAHRSRQSLAVILVDIDYFKSVNDQFGHVVGDHCITIVAAALKSMINRPGDLLARYGGEEFVYILPGSDEKDALKMASRAREAVERLHHIHKGQKVSLTISAGVAAWIPDCENAYKDLLNAADSALYRAKKAGRNCVMAAAQSKVVLFE